MASDSDLTYVNTSDLVNVLGLFKSIPDPEVEDTPTNENVGVGDNSATVFYLDHKSIVYASYTFYKGSGSTTTTELTETTDYTVDLDSGKLTLTSTGVTSVGTNTIFAKYDYIDSGMKISYLADVLLRAEKEVDQMINSIFTDGTATNPSYPSKTEIQSSEGFYQDRITTFNKPLIDISSTISVDISDSVTSIVLASGEGSNFPSSGSIIIGSEVISYTGITTDTLTGCTRGTQGTTAATHSEDDEVHSTIFFRSDTAEGTAVTWTIQPWNTSMYADEFGLIYKFSNANPDILSELGVASRIKIIYYHGYNTIPQDIKRLTLLLSKRMLVQDNISKSIIAGRDEFRPEMFNVDREEINRISSSYIVLPMGNT